MASQGPNYGSSATGVADAVPLWLNPGNVTASDDSYAECSYFSAGTVTSSLHVTGFGFSIPSTATVVGIEVAVECQQFGGVVQMDTVQLIYSGSTVGDNKGDNVEWGGASDSTYTYGGASDDWNASLTYSQVNHSTFGVRLRALIYDAGANAKVDSITVKVYYVVGYTMSAAAGSYSLSGTAASFIAPRTLYPDVGSYTISGITTGLLRGYAVIATPGSYVIFGHPAFPIDVTAQSSGAYGVQMDATTWQSGSYRVANDIAGYNIYVGEDALPDFDSAPATFSATLPASVAITPPGVGTKTLYVVVREQDQYGLESQNQHPQLFRIDTAGELVRLPLTSPQGLQLSEMIGGYVRVLCVYPLLSDEEHPPSHWKVWAGTSEPNTADPATLTLTATKVLATQVGPFSPGEIHVKVAAYRNTDTAMSAVLYDTITLSSTPDQPQPVRSGHQQD